METRDSDCFSDGAVPRSLLMKLEKKGKVTFDYVHKEEASKDIQANATDRDQINKCTCIAGCKIKMKAIGPSSTVLLVEYREHKIWIEICFSLTPSRINPYSPKLYFIFASRKKSEDSLMLMDEILSFSKKTNLPCHMVGQKVLFIPNAKANGIVFIHRKTQPEIIQELFKKGYNRIQRADNEKNEDELNYFKRMTEHYLGNFLLPVIVSLKNRGRSKENVKMFAEKTHTPIISIKRRCVEASVITNIYSSSMKEYRIDDGDQTPQKNFDMFEGEIELVSEIHDDFRNNLDGLVCYLLLSVSVTEEMEKGKDKEGKIVRTEKNDKEDEVIDTASLYHNVLVVHLLKNGKWRVPIEKYLATNDLSPNVHEQDQSGFTSMWRIPAEKIKTMLDHRAVEFIFEKDMSSEFNKGLWQKLKKKTRRVYRSPKTWDKNEKKFKKSPDWFTILFYALLQKRYNHGAKQLVESGCVGIRQILVGCVILQDIVDNSLMTKLEKERILRFKSALTERAILITRCAYTYADDKHVTLSESEEDDDDSSDDDKGEKKSSSIDTSIAMPSNKKRADETSGDLETKSMAKRRKEVGPSKEKEKKAIKTEATSNHDTVQSAKENVNNTNDVPHRLMHTGRLLLNHGYLEDAIKTNNRAFLDNPTVKSILNQMWYGEDRITKKMVVVYILLAISHVFVMPVLTIRSKCTTKCYRLYELPVMKFLLHMIGMLSMLVAFAYMLLFDDDNGISALLVLYWMLNFFLAESIQFSVSIARGRCRTYLTDWWNVLDWVAIATYTCARLLELEKSCCTYRNGSKILLVLTFIWFCIRLLNLYCISERLGPTLIIIRKMFRNTFTFMAIMMVIMTCYSVSYNALLHPKSSFCYLRIEKIMQSGYWMLFQQLDLDTEENKLTKHDCNMNRSTTGMSNNCFPSDTGERLALYVKALYGLVAVILMLNLLIAMYSDTFAKVHQQSELIWSELQISFLEEYSLKTIFPIHLQILALFESILHLVFGLINFKYNKISPNYACTARTAQNTKNQQDQIWKQKFSEFVTVFFYNKNFDKKMETTFEAEEIGINKARGEIKTTINEERITTEEMTKRIDRIAEQNKELMAIIKELPMKEEKTKRIDTFAEQNKTEEMTKRIDTIAEQNKDLMVIIKELQETILKEKSDDENMIRQYEHIIGERETDA